MLRPAPSGRMLHSRNPWTPADHPYIIVPAADSDIYCFNTVIPLRLQRRPGANLILELLQILRAVDKADGF
jgi:hypothetical protein